jgi:hypothetical protein
MCETEIYKNKLYIRTEVYLMLCVAVKLILVST